MSLFFNIFQKHINVMNLSQINTNLKIPSDQVCPDIAFHDSHEQPF